MSHSLEPMLRPRSVAVIGASDTKSRIGGRPIHFMHENGYRGKIYPVNPNRSEVQGLKAYPTITEVPEPVDCAVIAVPASIGVETIERCAQAGVKSVVMFTSGFAEVSDEGALMQQQIAQISKRSGMRICGPNCLGVFNVREGWYGTFSSVANSYSAQSGGAAIISQSGAFGAHVFLATQQRGVKSNYWVTTGNECDIHVAEVLEFYAQSDDVNVIMAYVEQVKDGPRMRNALALARERRKPVIFMKVGKSEVGAHAAASHTASVVGSDDIYDALFRQYGVHRAHSTTELADLAYACQFGIYPTGNKVCLQTISGGGGIHMADVADESGLEVPALSAEIQSELQALIPQGGVRNPVDFTANAINNPQIMDQNISLTMSKSGFDSHIVYMTSVPGAPFTRQSCLDTFTRLRESFPDEPVILSLQVNKEVAADYEKLNYPVFEDPAVAVQMLGALTRLGVGFTRGNDVAPPAAPADALAAPGSIISEFEAKRILASNGIPIAREALATNAEQAVAAWREFNRPVVMKIVSPDILHKTEIGGVVLNINSADGVSGAFATLLERAGKAKPDARIDGVLVCEMISGGVETVMGVVADPVFGPTVVFGLGGVLVEVLKDVSFRLAPFSVAEAHRMIDEIRGRAVLDGVRGAPAGDVEALARSLAAMSVFAAANADNISSIDVNPFIVRPDGVFAVDALIVPPGE
ncbi:MAG: acetate--CoA ligase family protein [Burkholderiaceae bacterium]